MAYSPPPPPWMPGAEAIAHICQVERCREAEAIEQLRAAIVGLEVGARLLDVKRPPIGSSPLQVHCDSPVRPGSEWTKAKILPDGKVRFGKGRRYAFDVLRTQLLKHWLRKSTSANETRCTKWLIADLQKLACEGGCEWAHGRR
jgi:hypothetical protein